MKRNELLDQLCEILTDIQNLPLMEDDIEAHFDKAFGEINRAYKKINKEDKK